MPAFRDHFSRVATSYAEYRPHYPAALFEWLASELAGHERAWDCGTGSGQAAVALASHVGVVVATDASAAQLVNAHAASRVHYAVMRAEVAALANRSVDLLTVAQALHWFDIDRFFTEADRVLRPGGVLAVWSYGLATISPGIDRILARFYHDTLRRYWPVERAMVDTGYAGISLPYPEIPPRTFAMTASWSLLQLGGYLSTWSAVSRYRIALDSDPVPSVITALAPLWGSASTRDVRWRLIPRVARKPM